VAKVNWFGGRHPSREKRDITALNNPGKWIGRARSRDATVYQVTDRLTHGRTVCVPGDEIAVAVSAWLAELGTFSPLVEDLARAARAGDWPAVHALGEHLSVKVASLPAMGPQRAANP
jgi:hypothetical protein